MKRIAAGILLSILSAVLLLMISAPRVESQNVYTPPPGAIRVYQGDYIGVDATGCGVASPSGILVGWSFLPIGATRRQDNVQTMALPNSACPTPVFVNYQIPLSDGWLIAAATANGAGPGTTMQGHLST